MKKLKLKTALINDAYKVLDTAKYSNLTDQDKVKLWKIFRKLHPIATKLEEEKQDASKRLAPNEDLLARLQKCVQYEKLMDEKADKSLFPMTDEDYIKTVKEYRDYKKLLESALSELEDKEEELEIEVLSEDAFGKLISSNDWTLKQVDSLEFLIE